MEPFLHSHRKSSINAAGLQADVIAAMIGIDVDAAGYRSATPKDRTLQ